MKSKIWTIIEIIAGIVLIVLIGFFVKRKIEDHNFLKSQTALKETITTVDSELPIESGENQIKIRDIKEERNLKAIEEVERIRKDHPSVIAIIEIPNTEILYPIVQGEDNLFYLDHDKDGNYHPFGEVYLDYRNDSKFTDNNSVVYGHNIRSAKTIFNNLLNYSEQEFFENHKNINIYSLEGFKQYEIISVFKAKPQEPYRETGFDSREGFEKFVANYHHMSLVESSYDENNLDSIITLSTCFDNSYRFVIQGVRVND